MKTLKTSELIKEAIDSGKYNLAEWPDKAYFMCTAIQPCSGDLEVAVKVIDASIQGQGTLICYLGICPAKAQKDKFYAAQCRARMAGHWSRLIKQLRSQGL